MAVNLRNNPKFTVIYATYNNTASYYDDWLDGFKSRKDIILTAINITAKGSYLKVANSIKETDAIILLHSTNADNVHYLRPFKELLKRRRTNLLIFLGNEFNSPIFGAGIRDKIHLMKEISPDFIGTQLPLSAATFIYNQVTGSKIIELPPALNPARFYPFVEHQERPIDIGVRSYVYYPFIGDEERNSILQYFSKSKLPKPLKIDIETDPSKRLSSTEWARFLNNCKGTISTEAGSYYLEPDDMTVRKISKYIKNKLPSRKKFLLYLNESRLKYLLRNFLNSLGQNTIKNTKKALIDPNSVYYEVDFKDIYNKFFKNYSNPVNGKCISSRHFDAIGTKTCQIMFPGYFNGILKPDENYIPLNRDFSNISEVLEKFLSLDFRSKIVDSTYEYVMDCHTYNHRIDKVIELFR